MVMTGPPVTALHPGFAICLLPNLGQMIFIFLSEPQCSHLENGDKHIYKSQTPWLTPVIPSHWKAEAGGLLEAWSSRTALAT